MTRKQYQLAYNIMRGLGAIRKEEQHARDAYHWKEHEKLCQALDQWDWDLMAACGHNIDVRDHIEEAYAQRPVQPRRKRFFK